MVRGPPGARVPFLCPYHFCNWPSFRVLRGATMTGHRRVLFLNFQSTNFLATNITTCDISYLRSSEDLGDGPFLCIADLSETCVFGMSDPSLCI